MQEDTNVSPINPLPSVVAALFIMMIGIEVVFALGARGIIGDSNALGWRVAAVETYGFNGQILDWMLVNGVYPVEHLIRFVAFLLCMQVSPMRCLWVLWFWLWVKWLERSFHRLRP